MRKPNVVPRRWRVRFWAKCMYGNGWEPYVIEEHWCITEQEGEGYRRHRDDDWGAYFMGGGYVISKLEYVEEGEPDERWEDDETETVPGTDALWPEYLRRSGGSAADR